MQPRKRGGGTVEVKIQGTRGKKNRGLQGGRRKNPGRRGERKNREHKPNEEKLGEERKTKKGKAGE
jgi:hypothetical protein